jgi:hypothetical protein
MRGYFSDYRDTAIRGLGVECGITADGALFIGPVRSQGKLPSLNDTALTLESTGGVYRLSAGNESVEATVPDAWLTGGVAMVCHSGNVPSAFPVMREPNAANAGKPAQTRGGTMRFWFEDWKLEGPGAVARPERAWGPILFTQYTLNNGVLKMTAQMAPLEDGDHLVALRLKGRALVRARIEPVSSTAHFRVESCNGTSDVPFELVFGDQTYTGTVRRNPLDKNEIVAGSLTCQGDFGFPHAEVARGVAAAKPDILFFTGDQLYEANGGYGIQRTPARDARLDYLRKWYMFGWAWGELTRHVPTVCLADDHDVYHGNVWGAGGRRAEVPRSAAEPQAAQQAGQDSGGYVMPARWVNMVYRTQSSHLPDSPDASPIEQGITAHYGTLNWGGISFAIIEDRKWKSAPKTLMPAAKIRNGWPQNPEWNAATQGDVPGAQLLGERQERYLEQWAGDWPDGIDMKAVVSATIFCNLCTLPPGMTSDAGTPKIPVQPPGGYAPDEHPAVDHDSNGWPQTPRNRALRSIRSCLAVHLAGDQHLASTLQYGIDDFDDGPWAICSPAISNIFPRRWFPPEPGANRKPGAPKYTGQFLDGFGNHMTVHAVANPHQSDVTPHALHERAPGFGIVRFDRKKRTIRFENYPRRAHFESGGMYPGWPITIRETDNGLNEATYELRLPRRMAGLVVVTKQGESRPALTWRPPGALDRIPIWSAGLYEVQVGGRRAGTLTAVERKL